MCSHVFLYFSDYYNYYYGGQAQKPEASDTKDCLDAAAEEVVNGEEATGGSTPVEAANANPDDSVAVPPEVCFVEVTWRRMMYVVTQGTTSPSGGERRIDPSLTC